MPTDREAWLNATVEDALDPALPICDPHHHLWDYPHHRYLLDDLLRDTGSGHNVVQTVFVECVSMYHADGPDDMKPVGETEFVQGVAERSAADGACPTAVCAGIVGFADLTLGDGVQAVLEAHLAAGPDRFRGIRHATSWHASPDVRNAHTGAPAGLMQDVTFRTGCAASTRSA